MVSGLRGRCLRDSTLNLQPGYFSCSVFSPQLEYKPPEGRDQPYIFFWIVLPSVDYGVEHMTTIQSIPAGRSDEEASTSKRWQSLVYGGSQSRTERFSQTLTLGPQCVLIYDAVFFFAVLPNDTSAFMIYFYVFSSIISMLDFCLSSKIQRKLSCQNC